MAAVCRAPSRSSVWGRAAVFDRACSMASVMVSADRSSSVSTCASPSLCNLRARVVCSVSPPAVNGISKDWQPARRTSQTVL